MRIAVMASIGEGNLGDEIILESQILSLHKACGDDVVIDVFSADVAETRERFEDFASVIVHPFFPVGPRSILRGMFDGSLWKSLWSLWKSDYVIIGGGGIIYSQEMEVGINPLWVWHLRTLFLKVFDVKLIFSSIGVEYLAEGDEMLLQKLFQNAHAIAVRDVGSKKKLLNAGVKEAVVVKHDIVFDMTALDSVDPVKNDSRRVVIIPREWGKVRGDVAVVFWREVAELLEKKGYDPYFVAMSYRVPDDREMIYSIIEEKGWQYFSGPYVRKELEEIMLASQGVISVRLHGMIMAMHCEKPLVALGYGNKTASLSAYFDLPFSFLEDLAPDAVVALYEESLGSFPESRLARNEKIAALDLYSDWYRGLFSKK